MVTDEEFKKLKQSVISLESRIAKLEAHFGEMFGSNEARNLKTFHLEIDVTKLPFVKDLKAVRDKCLALLDYVNERYPQNPKLTTDQIKNIFAERFGLTTITGEAISMALKEATGTYVTRERIAGGKPEKYLYWILPSGKEHIKKVLEDLHHAGVDGKSELHRSTRQTS